MKPTNPLPRRHCLRAGAAAALATWLAGCASLDPRLIRISESQLQALLEREFPRRQRVMELLDVELSAPRVQLRPQRDRVATALDLSAVERVGGRTLRGSLALEHALRFEPSDATLRLASVRVESLRLDAGGSALGAPATRLGAALVERVLDDFVVYRLGDERRRRMVEAGVNNADVAVTSRGIELRLRTDR